MAIYQPYVQPMSAAYQFYILAACPALVENLELVFGRTSTVFQLSVSRMSAECRLYIRRMSAGERPFVSRMSACEQAYISRVYAAVYPPYVSHT